MPAPTLMSGVGHGDDQGKGPQWGVGEATGASRGMVLADAEGRAGLQLQGNWQAVSRVSFR